jgi:hypothetical protein
MCKACAARACAFANSVYNRRSSATNFTLMMGMVMLSIWLVWPELSIPVKNRLCGFGSLLSKRFRLDGCGMPDKLSAWLAESWRSDHAECGEGMLMAGGTAGRDK